MRLMNITKLVKEILEYIPSTRDDDYLLWLKVLEITATAVEYNATFAHCITLNDFLSTAKYSNYPHFETVSRARRKIQENYPELRASAETQAARSELEEQYKEYAKTNV